MKPVLAFVLFAILRTVLTPQASPLPFSCAVFTAITSESDLKARFGSTNVTAGLVPWGGAEGDFNEGTILFADQPDARLEILWQDRVAKRAPDWVDIRGNASRWITTGGVALGMDLKKVEQLNGRPFRLGGYGSDLNGGIYTWSGGRLERQNEGVCRVGFHFAAPDVDKRPDLHALLRQVYGERPFSSGHPAMQGLNPRIDEAVMSYHADRRSGGQ